MQMGKGSRVLVVRDVVLSLVLSNVFCDIFCGSLPIGKVGNGMTPSCYDRMIKGGNIK